MEYVSLGGTCSVAFNLQELSKTVDNKYREHAYPFDWVRVDSLDNIRDIIENHFNEFIESCKKVNESMKFPISQDDYFPYEDSDKQQKSIIMENKYGVRFYHDFTDCINIETIINKYNRRIHRFMELLNDKKEIIFVRDEQKMKKINKDKIERFIKLLYKINNNIKFKLIIIIHNPENKDNNIFNELKDNPNIKIINDINKFGDWKRQNLKWIDILKS